MAIGEWGEGAATVVLFSLAQLLEARSLERARRAIGSAADAWRRRRRSCAAPAASERVPAAQVRVGESSCVGPGERLPLDGVVEQGRSELDQSPLTGEARPCREGAGRRGVRRLDQRRRRARWSG